MDRLELIAFAGVAVDLTSIANFGETTVAVFRSEMTLGDFATGLGYDLSRFVQSA